MYDVINFLTQGIKEEIARNNNCKSFLESNPNTPLWTYGGKKPNKERYKRYRLLLEEELKKQEKKILTRK